MPPKRTTSSNKLIRKSSSNSLTASDVEKNSLSNMFKRIESTDSFLRECTLCHEKIKSCLFKDHLNTKCPFRLEKCSVKNEPNTCPVEEDIIILEECSAEVSITKVSVKREYTESDFEAPKRPKLEVNDLKQEEVVNDQQEDDLIRNVNVDNLVNNLKQDKNESNSEINPNVTNYYLDNFINAIQSVLAEDKFSYLFDQTDLMTIEKFNSQSEKSKLLYVRLFQRKFKWLPFENINYEHISTDLTEYLNELLNNSFLIDESSISTYEEIIYLFRLPQLKELAKTCHITSLSSNQSNKTEIIKLILQHFKTQKSLMFNFSSNKNINSKPNYMIQCKKVLGKCFKLNKSIRGVFVRALILFSLSSSYIADLNNTGQQQLLIFFLFTDIDILLTVINNNPFLKIAIVNDKHEKYKIHEL